MSESFGPIARHYDRLMAPVPYDMWMGYFRLLLDRMEAEPETILDVCCGTGAMTERIHQDGFRVAGVDLSPEMIEVARQKAAAQGLGIDYFVADAAEMDLGLRFDAALSFFDSFNYITDPGRLQLALARVAAHLNPGGVFIFDLNTDFAFREKMFDQHDTRKKAAVKYDWKGDYDPERRLIRVEMRFWTDEESFREVHVQRAHPLDEVQQGLEAAGFEDICMFDGYTLDRPHKRSDRVHLACRLAAAP